MKKFIGMCLVLVVLLLVIGCSMKLVQHDMVQIKGKSIYLGMTPQQVQEEIGKPERVKLITDVLRPERQVQDIAWGYGGVSLYFNKTGTLYQIIENLNYGKNN